MAHPFLIQPQADAACGRLFFDDRRNAEAHRVALEVWIRATGRAREGYRLAVCRCRRCGGFHIGRRPIVPKPVHSDPLLDREGEIESYQREDDFVSR